MGGESGLEGDVVVVSEEGDGEVAGEGGVVHLYGTEGGEGVDGAGGGGGLVV